MKQIPLKSFYFLRHGETDWNRADKVMGKQDIPLNDLGLAQALIAQKLLKSKSISTIISSPLLRARQTAYVIQQSISVPLIEIDELEEVCFGEKEGQKIENNLWINNWIDGNKIKGSENYIDCFKRVKRGLEKALQHLSPVLIISHGIVNLIIQKILRVQIIDLDNCETIFYHAPHNPNYPWGVSLSRGRDIYEYE